MNLTQLKAIFWLRWCLTRNQVSKAGPLGAFLTLLVTVIITAGGVMSGAAGLIGGIALGRMAKPEIVLVVCDVGMAFFLFIWLVGVLSELQRAESIDLGKLLHLPISLRQVFFFNFAVSHASPAIAMVVPAMLTLPIGLAITGGPRLVLLAPVFFSLLLAITAWTYCLRGWLSGLMANRRKARAITLYTTIVIVAVAQLPNLLVHTRIFRSMTHPTAKRAKQPGMPEEFVRLHKFIPVGWPGYAAKALAEHEYYPAFCFSAAALALAGMGLMRSYTLTLRFYTGAASGSAAAGEPREFSKASQDAPATPQRSMLLWSVPFVKDDIAGLACATLRSILRAPEVKLALVMPVVAMCILFGSVLGRMKGLSSPLFAQFFVSGLILMVPFALAPTMSNVFGLDRGGFRALVLSPMQRKDILLARNLAFLCLDAVTTLLLLAIATPFLRVPAIGVLTGLLQALIAFVLYAMGSNWLAVVAPYKFANNSLKAKKFKPLTLISALASLIVIPLFGGIVMLPALLQYFWDRFAMPAWLPIGLMVALVLLMPVCLVYWVVLPGQGRLLHNREIKILEEVTSDME